MGDLISRKEIMKSIEKMDLSYMQQKDVMFCIEDAINRIPTVFNEDNSFKPIKYASVSQYWGKCRCGAGVFDNNKYCSDCGVKLDWSDDKEGAIKDE